MTTLESRSGREIMNIRMPWHAGNLLQPWTKGYNCSVNGEHYGLEAVSRMLMIEAVGEEN